MREAVSEVLDLRAVHPAGLGRLLSWSIGIHVATLAGALMIQVWTAQSRERAPVLTVTLSGSVGPITGGMTSLGQRQVDAAAPTPPRPEPVPAVPPRATSMTRPAKPTATPPPKTSQAAPTRSTVAQATGSRVAPGASVVETGARGQGTGLATGGGIGTQTVDPEFEFCCKEYLQLMQAEIHRHVVWQQETPGTVVIRFEVGRSGAIEPARVTVERSSGLRALDINAMAAVRLSRLPALPPAYGGATLVVLVTIPYS